MKIVIPVNNSIRAIKRQYNAQPTGSIFTEKEAPFNRQYFNTRYEDEILMNNDSRINLHGTLFADLQNYIIQEYRGDTIVWQLRSDTDLTLDDNIKIRAIKADGTTSSITPTITKKIANTEYKVKYNTVKFVEKDGRIAFYFESGTQEEFDASDNVIESKSFYLNGRLPEFLENGQDYSFTSIGASDGNDCSGIYDGIVFDEDLNKWLAVTDVPYNATSNTTGILITTYERDTMDVYELSVSDFVEGDCMYFEITTSEDSFETILETWETDYIHIRLDSPDPAMLFQWRHAGSKFMIDFRTGLLNYAYLPVTMYQLTPSGEVQVYNNEIGGGQLLDSEYQRKFTVKFVGIPRHLVEKIALIIRHDTMYINGRKFVYVGDGESTEQLEETLLSNSSFEVFEPELLGIYSDNYINTTPSDDARYLLIDGTHYLDIGGGQKLRI